MTERWRRSSSTSAEDSLACPRCGPGHPVDGRFCAGCGMPLVHAGGDEDEPLDEATKRARKVLPRYARGEPRRVGVGLNLPQAELMQGILLEEGIPSFLRRSGGFDVPDFLAAGPRDILVPESGVEAARQLLAVDGEAPPLPEEEATSRLAMRIAAGMLAGLLLFGAVAGLILSLIS